MKTAKELGLGVIKTENKEGTEALKNIHYRINDILYPTMGKYIDHAYAEYLYNSLCSLGSELSELKVSDKATPKKNEILVEVMKGISEVNKITNNIGE